MSLLPERMLRGLLHTPALTRIETQRPNSYDWEYEGSIGDNSPHPLDRKGVKAWDRGAKGADWEGPHGSGHIRQGEQIETVNKFGQRTRITHIW